MLFYLFFMFDDYWRINHRSQNSVGKSTIKTPILRRSVFDGKHSEAPIIPDDGGAKRGAKVGPRGPHHVVAWVMATSW